MMLPRAYTGLQKMVYFKLELMRFRRFHVIEWYKNQITASSKYFFAD